MQTCFVALELVKVRAESMQRASELVPSGMMSVFVGAASKLSEACKAARHHCESNLRIEDPVCNIANFLQAECKVLAGHVEVRLITQLIDIFGIYGRILD